MAFQWHVDHQRAVVAIVCATSERSVSMVTYCCAVDDDPVMCSLVVGTARWCSSGAVVWVIKRITDTTRFRGARYPSNCACTSV